MKKSLLFMLFAALCTIGFAQKTTEWTAAADSDGLWTTEANWSNGVPVDTGKVVLKTSVECIYDAEADINVTQIVCGDGGEGAILTVKKGSITTGEVWTGIGWVSPGTLNVEEGAAFTFGQHMWVGWEAGSVGTVNINGGTVTSSGMFGLGGFGTEGAGIGIVNINSGSLVLNAMHETQSIFEGSYVNIVDGEFIVPVGSYKTALSYLAEGRIKAYGGNGRVWHKNEGGKVIFYGIEFGDAAEVLETTPANGATDVAVDSDIEIEFLNNMDIESVAGAITISPEFTNMTLAWDQVSNTTLTISADDMDNETEYTITIGTEAKDVNGNALAENFVFSFTTEVGEVSVQKGVLNTVSMYPNPFASTITIANMNNVQAVFVSNVLGQNIITVPVTNQTIEINTDNLNSGIYMITIVDNDNNSRTERMVKK